MPRVTALLSALYDLEQTENTNVTQEHVYQ